MKLTVLDTFLRGPCNVIGKMERFGFRYAKFEMKNGEVVRARNVYERAVENLLADDDDSEEEAGQLFVAFAEFEQQCKEIERARCVYKLALDHIRRGRRAAEEKRYWQRYIYLWINYALCEELDAGDVGRARDVYRECLNLIPHDKFSFSKIWVLAAQFEIRQLNVKAARNILGNAIGKAAKDKIFKKYIELELQLHSIDRCRKLYERYVEWSLENCYAWIKYAELERSLSEPERTRAIFELAVAQPVLDMPELLWKAYIDFEMSEGEFERTRELHERLLDRTKHLKVGINYAKFKESAMEEDLDLPERKKQRL